MLDVDKLKPCVLVDMMKISVRVNGYRRSLQCQGFLSELKLQKVYYCIWFFHSEENLNAEPPAMSGMSATRGVLSGLRLGTIAAFYRPPHLLRVDLRHMGSIHNG